MDELWQEQIEEQQMIDFYEAERQYLEEMQKEDLLTVRGSTHGDFKSNSVYVQRAKYMVRQQDNWDKLEDYQKEAIDMTLHKLGRILTGDPKFIDSWRDIVGYNQLVVDQLTVDEEASDVRNVKMFNVKGIWHDESSSI